MSENNLEELYQKHSKAIYYFLYRMTEDIKIAEELTQETFLQAFLSLNNFRGDCKATTWLYQIAKNVWRNYLRKKGGPAQLPIDVEQLSDLFDPLNILLEKEDKKIFYDALKKLPTDMRKIVYLKITSDLTFHEIGELLERTETWARTNYFRAKLKLKEYLHQNSKERQE